MFYESYYPKKELKSLSNELKEFSERFLLHWNWQYKLEKNCFLWFFIIRKLIESQTKVSTNLKTIEINIKSYKFIGKKKLFRPYGYPDEYDYESPKEEKISLYDLTHQFIHSQVFFWNKEKKWLKSIFVCSDFQMYKSIYEINIVDVIDIFIKFSDDFPTKLSAIKDIRTWKVKYNCE